MLKHAPTFSCLTHSKEIALLSPFVHFAFIQTCVCKVVVFASDHPRVCVFVNVPAGNKIAAITCQILCPLAADCRYVRVRMGVYAVSRVVRKPPPPSHPLGVPCSQYVRIDQSLEWRNACPAHKINGCCFLSSSGLLLSAMNTKHIL